MEKEFNKLLETVRTYNNKKEDLELLEKAWKFSKLAHAGQKRLTGEPYVMHELETAKILASWKMDTSTILAGLLHDAVEDGAANFSDIENEFGKDAAFLVGGVTKVSHIKLKGSSEEQFVENLRKMFMAMAKDLRVVIVKLADRLHNMQTLSALPEEKQARIARETLEIYTPLAERLGMGEVKAQLDDLAFSYVYPKAYKKVKKKSKKIFKRTEEHISEIKNVLEKSLVSEKVEAEIKGREKHLYSLWKKLERSEINWDFSKVYDIVALRILVETIPDCYIALGIVHKKFKPIPYLGISDFIAQPKPNGYRSIHTKVFGPGDKAIEIQVRTHEMHEQAEYGIASHWAYSEEKAKGSSKAVKDDIGVFAPQKKLEWVKQLADWQKEIKDSKEFLKSVKFDALAQRIFIFSPNGDVYDLPINSTPVDFAYAVHTGLGKYIKAALVDKKIVPLDYKLSSGQVVEIIKLKNEKAPNSDWLNFVVTSLARRQINKYLRKGGFDRK